MKAKFLIAAGLLVVFLLGIVTGLVGAGVMARPLAAFARGDTKPLEQVIAKQGIRRLNLDEEQKAEFRELVAEAGAEISGFQKETGDRVRQLLHEKYEPRLREILDDEQKELWTAWHQELRDRGKRRHREDGAEPEPELEAEVNPAAVGTVTQPE